MHIRKRVLLPLLGLVVLLPVCGGAGFVRFGVFDPAADSPHWGITESLMKLTLSRAVTVRASDIVVPDLEDPELIRSGAGNYDAMCVGCHLAPGMPDGEIQKGMYPPPPNLSAVDGLDPAVTFWTIKHGLKMTGMPAWGASMENAPIWGMTAFVRKLPSMSAEEYATWVASSGGHDHGGASPQAEHGATSGMAGMSHHDDDATQDPMPGMDHSKIPAAGADFMAGMDHSKMPGTGAGSMAGMDHSKMSATGTDSMDGMDHSKMPATGVGSMAGMDHSKMPGMNHSKAPDLPPRQISGPAEAALQAFHDALQVGNVDLALERLAPDLVVVESGRTERSRDDYARGHMKADMEFLKNADLQLLSRRVEESGEQTIITSEMGIQSMHAGKPVDITSTETATMRATPDGWQITRLEWASSPH